jgi:hypothetical protein
MNKKKIYVGVSEDGKREIFKSSSVPTRQSGYVYVIGHFTTMLGAKIMKEHGQNNPHIAWVADAERLARKGKAWLKENNFNV